MGKDIIAKSSADIHRNTARDVKKWFSRFNGLNDFSIGRQRLTNADLETFRNEETACIRSPETGRWLYRPRLTLQAIDRHLIHQGADTIWLTNGGSYGVVLLMLDVDDKDGAGDADQVVEALHGLLPLYVEPSTHGAGRHCFLKLDRKYVASENIWEIVEVLRLKLRWNLRSVGAKLDVINGCPTCWIWKDGRWAIEKRGTTIRMPYLPWGLQPLDQLPVVSWQQLQDVVAGLEEPQQETGVHIPERYMGRTMPRREDQSGLTKKQQLVSERFRFLNGPPDVDEVLAIYEADWHPSGNSEKDRSRRRYEIERCIKAFSKTFIPSNGSPYAFRPGAYLSKVQAIVPAEAFHWERREKLDHQRLADFIGIKLQDAFRAKTTFLAKCSRDATIDLFRVLKREQVVSWQITTNTYRKLLEIACHYDLLHIYEDYIPPVRNKQGIRKAKGVARMIGPGEALKIEYEAFQPIYEAHRVPEELLALVA